jgi:DNA topoisomerase-1
MPLVIIESPNKIKKLGKILGRDYKVMATKGHVMDLPAKKTGVNTRNKSFEPTYQVVKGKGDTIRKIVEEARNHDTIYIATDPDREGEAIGFHIASHLPKRGKTIQRVRFNAIAPGPVRQAFANPTELDQALFDAQQARRVTDRLVGYRVSPIMWRKGLSGASAGRVQSVALKYVVDREREIEAFVPDEYWNIDAVMEAGFTARMWGLDGAAKTITQGKHARGLATLLNNQEEGKVLKVASIKRSERTSKPPAPFTTSSLQQASNNILGWGVSKTMTVAQKIFEKGVITYHRTDSVSTDKEALSQLREDINRQHGGSHLSSSVNSYKSKKASQEAHECIRPTGEDHGELTAEEFKLFDLIRNRFMASQMAPARFEQMRVELVSVSTQVPINFRVTGSKLLFDGYLKVYGSGRKDLILPDMDEGDILTFSQIGTEQKFTQPPGRYSDAALVKKMEADGVGRPATYASILNVILKREFVVKEGRSFRATEKGKMVYDYLTMFFPNVVDPVFTANMEEQLDEIASGRRSYTDTLGAWYEPFKAEIKAASEGDARALFRTEHKCPACGEGHFLKRPSKDGGWWYGCDQWPDCKTIAETNDTGSIRVEDGVVVVKQKKPEVEQPDVESIPQCPRCASDMRLVEGKFGKFWGCTQWKRGCKGTLEYEDPDAEKPEREIFQGVACPECNSEMYKTTGKFGEYLRCTSSTCKGTHAIPMGVCPTCGDWVVKRYSRKKKKHFYSCAKWSDQCDFVTSRVKDIKPMPGETVVVDL